MSTATSRFCGRRASANAASDIATGNQAYSSLVYTGLVLDAALQIAGVVTAIVGASTHRRREVRFTSNRLSISF